MQYEACSVCSKMGGRFSFLLPPCAQWVGGCLHGSMQSLRSLSCSKFGNWCMLFCSCIGIPAALSRDALHPCPTTTALQGMDFVECLPGGLICSLLPSLGTSKPTCVVQSCITYQYFAMLCYAMLCYAMLCYAVPCHAMPCYGVPCHAVCYAICCAVLCFTVPPCKCFPF